MNKYIIVISILSFIVGFLSYTNVKLNRELELVKKKLGVKEYFDIWRN